jgi:hypothetical protein
MAGAAPNLPMAGAYEVFAWRSGTPNHDQYQRALIHIHPTWRAGHSIPDLCESGGRGRTMEQPGIQLRLHGLRERVALFEEDRSRLATLGGELAAAAW